MPAIDDLASPSILIDDARLQRNLLRMQAVCDAHHVELRPHIKTHKLVPIARRQLDAGARGLTCAKVGEAEAMLSSGVRSLFVAHSLVDRRLASRLAALMERVDDFRVAVTSELQLTALSALAAGVGHRLPVMMALDTGLAREGARDLAAARRLAAAIAADSRLELRGFYTHEGQFYGQPLAAQSARLDALLDQLCSTRDAIDPALALWPGCSVTAAALATSGAGRIQAVRPGAYVFGDLALSTVTGVMPADEIALHVLATVVDKPAPGLALIDAGSKTFSSDRTPDSVFAIAADGRDITVARVNEEHGYLRGTAVDALAIGERLRFTPAHVCTVVNLADTVALVDGSHVREFWTVDARGRTQ